MPTFTASVLLNPVVLNTSTPFVKASSLKSFQGAIQLPINPVYVGIPSYHIGARIFTKSIAFISIYKTNSNPFVKLASKKIFSNSSRIVNVFGFKNALGDNTIEIVYGLKGISDIIAAFKSAVLPNSTGRVSHLRILANSRIEQRAREMHEIMKGLI